MGHDYRGDRQLIPDPLNEVVNAVGHDGVQAGGRLIIEDNLRLVDDGAGQANPFAHAPGELRGVLVFGAGQLDCLEHLGHAVGDLRLRERGVPAEGEGHILGDRHGIEQGRALEEHAELAADRQEFPFVHRHNVLVLDQDFAALGLEQADQVLEQHALAAAAAADNDHRLALVDAKTDAIQDGVAAETLPQVADFNHSACKAWPSVRVRKKFVMSMVIDE